MTERSIQERWQEHCKDYLRRDFEQRPLYSAMKKYGIEHFHISILEETDDPVEREIYWIEQKQSFKHGYNATQGGDGKHYLDYDLICKTYQEHDYNQTETAKILGIDVHSVRNALHAKNISIRKSPTLCKPVIQYNKNGEEINRYFSCTEGARMLLNSGITSAQLGTVVNKITECANHKRKSAYNYIWEFE